MSGQEFYQEVRREMSDHLDNDLHCVVTDGEAYDLWLMATEPLRKRLESISQPLTGADREAAAEALFDSCRRKPTNGSYRDSRASYLMYLMNFESELAKRGLKIVRISK